ncbi:MAG: hypothetical protein ABIH83_00645 [Candidatus Micrarchaeota archaeon]
MERIINIANNRGDMAEESGGEENFYSVDKAENIEEGKVKYILRKYSAFDAVELDKINGKIEEAKYAVKELKDSSYGVVEFGGKMKGQIGEYEEKLAKLMEKKFELRKNALGIMHAIEKFEGEPTFAKGDVISENVVNGFVEKGILLPEEAKGKRKAIT